MTITQVEYEGNGNMKKRWGPERHVIINRIPGTSLGLSVVGGSVDVYNEVSEKYESTAGIFIKNITRNTPAERTKQLKAGDRIIEVEGISLRNSTHEQAVELIQIAGDPVHLIVQSLVCSEEHGQTVDRVMSDPRRSMKNRKDLAVTDDIQLDVNDNKRISDRKLLHSKELLSSSNEDSWSREMNSVTNNISAVPEPAKMKYSSEESSEDEDTRHLEGNVYTKAGIEISRKSAGNVKRSKAEIEADPEEEDEFGYTMRKIQKKYRNLGNEVLAVQLEKDRGGLGISLSGHKDRSKMAVLICGLNPSGIAFKTGGFMVGDEVIEVNGHVLQNRCHLNASSIIKGIPGTVFKFIVVRKPFSVNDLAVKPITQFPSGLDGNTINQFNQYKGVHAISVKKGQYGLGMMIIEGKHAEVGQGIFVSDIQEGSAAEQAGLQVGDLILAVNFDCLLGSTHDEATSLLKKAEGVVTLTVCNPNQKKIAQEEEKASHQKSSDHKDFEPSEISEETKSVAVKEPEKPKEPEVPQDPKDCKILVGKDTIIEFTRTKEEPIGFTIVGGSDTLLVGIFILDVYMDGAAGKDGRLKSGDQIIEFCRESFKSIEYEKAHASILKSSGTIHMVVSREEKPLEEIKVELQSKPGKGLGICITGFNCTAGAYISEIVPGGGAAENGKLIRGDRITEISGDNVQEASVEDIALLVKALNPVDFKVTRHKSTRT